MEATNNNSNIKNPDDILVLVNKKYYLSPEYVPANLIKPKVKWAKNSNLTSRQLRQEAAKALESLVHEASKQGIELYCISAYRS
jgi:zinc D-Ala-D-Ala carboxypeptidase